MNFDTHRTVIWNHLYDFVLKQTGEVYEAVKYSLGFFNQDGIVQTNPSGKMLRSLLCTFTCDSTGGNWEDALQSAISLELIHNFSLIHDDIQDKDTLRRHRPTTWILWGTQKAIIAGTITHCLGNIISLPSSGQSRSKSKIQLELSKILSKKCLQMIQGQILDLSFEHKNKVTVNEYLKMISGKTAALISCAMHMGAYISEQSPKKASLFGRIGHFLGLSYQIRDDILGIWGDPENTGKSVGSDIFRKKKSLPIIHGSQSAIGETLIEQGYQKQVVTPSDLDNIMAIMKKRKTQKYCQALAESYCQKAIKQIDSAPISNQSKNEMIQLAHYFIERNS